MQERSLQPNAEKRIRQWVRAHLVASNKLSLDRLFDMACICEGGLEAGSSWQSNESFQSYDTAA